MDDDDNDDDDNVTPLTTPHPVYCFSVPSHQGYFTYISWPESNTTGHLKPVVVVRTTSRYITALHLVHTQYLCVTCIPHNKERLCAHERQLVGPYGW